MDGGGTVEEANWTGAFGDARLVRTSKQASCNLAGEAVILNLESGIYYGLNDVGARIWDLLTEPRDLASLRDALLAEYEIDAETCQRDLVSVIESLVETGLVRVSREPAR